MQPTVAKYETAGERPTVHFSRGIPPVEAIPAREIAQHAAAIIEERPELAFQYAPIGGYLGDRTLRDGLAALYNASADDIFVGNGSLQVLDLTAARLLTGDRRDAIVEAPSYDRAVRIFQRHGGRVIGVPVETDGIDVAALRRTLSSSSPAFLYTIPDFQNPSGVTMSAEKRQAVAGLCAEFGCVIVEDIPYRELRYHGAAPLRIAELGSARVITIGSLAKILSPGLRIGYSISDAATAKELALLAENTYLSPSPLCQMIAARCLDSGVLQTSIARLRSLFGPRHDAAVSITRRLMPDGLLSVPNGGYFLSVHLRTDADEGTLLAASKKAGIVLTAGSAFYPPPIHPPAGTLFVRLPFQAMDPDEFEDGLERLADIALHAGTGLL